MVVRSSARPRFKDQPSRVPAQLAPNRGSIGRKRSRRHPAAQVRQCRVQLEQSVREPDASPDASRAAQHGGSVALPGARCTAPHCFRPAASGRLQSFPPAPASSRGPVLKHLKAWQVLRATGRQLAHGRRQPRQARPGGADEQSTGDRAHRISWRGFTSDTCGGQAVMIAAPAPTHGTRSSDARCPSPCAASTFHRFACRL